MGRAAGHGGTLFLSERIPPAKNGDGDWAHVLCCCLDVAPKISRRLQEAIEWTRAHQTVPPQSPTRDARTVAIPTSAIFIRPRTHSQRSPQHHISPMQLAMRVHPPTHVAQEKSSVGWLAETRPPVLCPSRTHDGTLVFPAPMFYSRPDLIYTSSRFPGKTHAAIPPAGY